MQQYLKQNLETRLVMNQMLRQAIDLLMLSNLELVQKIEQEIVVNPLLEEIDDLPQNISLEEIEENHLKTEKQKNDSDELAWKDYLEDDYNYKYSGKETKEDINYEDFTVHKQSLSEHLLWQLGTNKLPYHEFKVGELIIGNLDKRGYFIGDINELAQTLNISEQNVEKVLKIIQKFDPIGIGARNMAECLLIQARELYPMDKILHKVIELHLEDIGHRRFQEISDALGVNIEAVQKYFEIISSLEPYPGRQYSTENNKQIIPDVTIEKEDDKYIVKINNDYLPKLRINYAYKKLLQKSKDPEVKKYLKQKLSSASWLLHSIDQRKSTLFEVATKIVEYQKDFLDNGILFLKPMALSDIASQVNMHESTISRVTTNKYAQTPIGIFELKYFFVRGMENAYGEDISVARIKDKIKTIIDNENKEKPLSDQKIVELLKNDSLNIARRTVTKYREELNISTSSKRKKVVNN